MKADVLRRWRAANPERNRAIRVRYDAKNLELNRVRKLAWQKAHPEVGAARTRRRWAAKMQRTPPWADHKAINVFYEIAARVTRCTGILFSVDHIVPLQGKTVSGLHVHNNLRVIPQHANRLKSNRFEAA